MNTTIRSLGLVLVVAGAAAGCKRETAIDRVKNESATPPAAGAPVGAPATAAAADPVTLAVTVAKPEVALGDDIVFQFRITNTSGAPTTVNVPRLDRRCAEFRLRRAQGVATVTRIRADLSERGEFVYQAPEIKELAAGETLTKDVTITAIEAGKVAVTATWVRLGSVSPMVAPPVEITVTPADPKAPRLGVALETTHGTYTAVFRPDVAYNTVESFATLVKIGFYKDLKFHRILARFMAQGGDPKGTGEGGPGYFLPLEANLALRHTRGVMSMARTGIPDTAGSQFFIMFATRPDLDQGRYTTFAEMVSGEDTVKKLESVRVTMSPQGEPSAPTETVKLKSARLVTLP